MQSWKIRLNGLPVLMVFFYKNLISFTEESASNLTDVVVQCLSDENVEVREMAAKILSGLLRCSQRQSIIPLRVRINSQKPSPTGRTQLTYKRLRIDLWQRFAGTNFLVVKRRVMQIPFGLCIPQSLESVHWWKASHIPWNLGCRL